MAKAASIKVVLTNIGALKAKYGASGTARISAAVSALAAADRARGITTRLIALDSAAAMKKLGGRPVAQAQDLAAVKAAVDAVCKKLSPDYVMLLGAWDVVPHQSLRNPAASDPSNGDPDPLVPSDLPYASAAKFGNDVRKFLTATRVVGRLPDVPGSSNPAYLVELLTLAAKATPSPRDGYAKYFAATAHVWHASSAQNVQRLFGNVTALRDVPPATAAWPKRTLAALTHFFNCHGADTDPQFYGQKGNAYPVALRASSLAGKVTKGTVVAAECCYGAQLYDPKNAGGQPGICNTYLGAGAYGFFGSSTVAYGPADTNDDADLLCQYFLERMLSGASLGRATLEARHRFMQTAGTLDPIELKTLAQFNLMADPAVQPVVRPESSTSKAFSAAFVQEPAGGARALRRARLARMGAVLGQSVGVATSAPSLRAPASVRKTLTAAAAEAGVSKPHFHSFSTRHPPQIAGARSKKLGADDVEAIHLAIGRTRRGARPGEQVVAVVSTIQNGRIAKLRRVFSR